MLVVLEMLPASNSSLSIAVQSWQPLQPAATQSMRTGPSNELRRSWVEPLSTARSKVGATKESRSGTGESTASSSFSTASSTGAAVQPASIIKRTITETSRLAWSIITSPRGRYFNACSKSEVHHPVQGVPPRALNREHDGAGDGQRRPFEPFTCRPHEHGKPNRGCTSRPQHGHDGYHAGR